MLFDDTNKEAPLKNPYWKLKSTPAFILLIELMPVKTINPMRPLEPVRNLIGK